MPRPRKAKKRLSVASITPWTAFDLPSGQARQGPNIPGALTSDQRAVFDRTPAAAQTCSCSPHSRLRPKNRVSSGLMPSTSRRVVWTSPMET